ncbi:MAG: asparagine synthase-related protein [Candidatus Pacebacteria bacterium]|nr:asparagine synthase-related protein [Candidatus Paceibacterota bacterium]
MKKKVKALLLMSGGLDSMLAAKILQNQGVQVTPVCFKSFFFDCAMAQKACKQLGLKLKEIDFGKKHLAMLKAPRFGRGSAINPCIDCHLLMFKEAKKIMKAEGYDFVATGEVLGERPMSQNARALELLEKESGLKGLLLRPLSAKVLPETSPEKKGLVNREKLYGISGRGRKAQLELTNQFHIKEFPTPAGGCILTDKNYSDNLKILLSFKKNINENDALIIRQGRVFWENNVLIVVARDKAESETLKKMRTKGDLYAEPKNFTGPSVIARPMKKSSLLEMTSFVKQYLIKYSKQVPAEPAFTLWTLPKP